MTCRSNRTHAALCALAVTLAVGCETKSPEAPEVRAPEVRPSLRFGVLPATSASNAKADYAMFTQRIEQLLERRVDLIIPQDYDALIDLIEKGSVELAQLSAYLFVRVRPSIEADVLVQQRMAWDTEYRGVFVVPDGSRHRKLADLRGKRIAYVDRQSSAGYFYPRMKLRQLGLDPDSFFSETHFAGSHEKVLEMLASGAADVGAISEQTLSQGLSLRILERTDVIPDDVIVATSALSPDERAALRALFIAASDDPKLNLFMNRRGIETYVRPDLEVFAPLEKEMGLTTTVQSPTTPEGVAGAGATTEAATAEEATGAGAADAKVAGP